MNQGSILGPIFYAIFISPLFEIENLTCFADDKFPLAWNRNKSDLIKDMELKLRKIMDWLKDSGMKVNESKTDLCLFHRGDSTPISLNLYGKIVTSNKKINVLGVIFDSKFQWADQISNCINKSMKALNAIRLIKKNFHAQSWCHWLLPIFFSPLL